MKKKEWSVVGIKTEDGSRIFNLMNGKDDVVIQRMTIAGQEVSMFAVRKIDLEPLIKLLLTVK